jgi:hypothetical protein
LRRFRQTQAVLRDSRQNRGNFASPCRIWLSGLLQPSYVFCCRCRRTVAPTNMAGKSLIRLEGARNRSSPREKHGGVHGCCSAKQRERRESFPLQVFPLLVHGPTHPSLAFFGRFCNPFPIVALRFSGQEDIRLHTAGCTLVAPYIPSCSDQCQTPSTVFLTRPPNIHQDKHGADSVSKRFVQQFPRCYHPPRVSERPSGPGEPLLSSTGEQPNPGVQPFRQLLRRQRRFSTVDLFFDILSRPSVSLQGM